MAARFWNKVEKSNGCWTWIGAAVPRGYGRFYWNGKPRYAHRVSLELAGRAVPEGAVVMHTCDNPRCVNPKHLKVGTQSENMRDASRKGRIAGMQDWSGERNPRAKLSGAATAEISASPEPTKILADRFGVSSVRIQQIRRAAKAGGGFAEEHF